MNSFILRVIAASKAPKKLDDGAFARASKIESITKPPSQAGWYIVEKDGDAGPYKSKDAALRDGGTAKTVRYGRIDNRTGDFKKLPEPSK